MRLLAKLSALDAWNAIADEELVSHTDAHDLLGTLERVSEKARANTSGRFAARATRQVEGGGRHFVDAPPVLRRVDDEEAAVVATSLTQYLTTLSEDRHPLLARYAVHDVAFRVVGTGSVGTRSYVVLLLDHRGEPLVLQVKEARPSALEPHLATAGFEVPEVDHEGRRVVLGQKRMQVVSDILLGWTTVDGFPFQVRQFRNRKGSVDPAALAADQIDDYGRMTGALLARSRPQRRSPSHRRLLRQERRTRRGDGHVRRDLRGPHGGGPRGPGGGCAGGADRCGDGGLRRGLTGVPGRLGVFGRPGRPGRWGT